MQPVSFKETILARVMFVGFFALMGSAITLALFLKTAESFFWFIPAVLVGALTLGLYYFIWVSFVTRQVINISPVEISVTSRKHGRSSIRWLEVLEVYEVQNKTDELRENMPGLELLLTYYIMLPQTTSGQKRGLIVLKGEDGTKISIRRHMLYEHRLNQLLQAIDFYTTYPDTPTSMLRANNHN
jgi:hypothetical protein